MNLLSANVAENTFGRLPSARHHRAATADNVRTLGYERCRVCRRTGTQRQLPAFAAGARQLGKSIRRLLASVGCSAPRYRQAKDETLGRGTWLDIPQLAARQFLLPTYFPLYSCAPLSSPSFKTLQKYMEKTDIHSMHDCFSSVKS